MRKPYKTDLSDAQWALIRDIIPAPVPKPGYQPTDVREVVNTLLYQNKAGCQWDMLPHDLLPKSTVFDYFSRWRQDGTWDRLVDALRRKVREADGRAPEPTAAAVDSQSVPSSQVGGAERGYDGGKKVKGRKRHIAVDTLGLLLAVVVTAANISDGRAAPALVSRTALPTRENLRVIFGDARYHDYAFRRYLADHTQVRLEITTKPEGVKGFVVIRKRWVVERTFAWLAGYRRLSREYDKRVDSSESRVKIASIHTMLKRLTRKNKPTAFVNASAVIDGPKAA
jgi:putative transposase